MIAEPLRSLAVPLEELSPLPGNPRRGDVAAVKRSLERFGQRKPVVARADGTVIAGNHMLAAARELGWPALAVTRVDDDDATAKAFALADNRTAELGSFDLGDLAAMAAEVHAVDPDLLSATSYSEEDLNALLAGLEAPSDLADPDLDEVPEPPAQQVTRPGDLWLLGDGHRLLCGDSREPADMERLLAGQRVNVAVTSPPYADRREYDEASGFKPIPPDEYVAWFEATAANVRAALADDGSWFVNIKAGVTLDGIDTELYVLDLVIAHVRQWGWHWATEFCWERNGVPKSVTRRFKNQFEPVYQFTKGDWKMRPDAVQHWSDNVPLAGGPGVGDTSWAASQGGNGPMFGARKRAKGTKKLMSDVQGENAAPGEYIAPGMAYPGNRLPTFAGTHEATGHTAAFPVGLPAWFVKAYSDPGDAILDPFMGSGSTLIAAHQEGRIGYGLDVSPRYCDITLKRWQIHTGTKPVLEATGEPHDFTA